MLVLAFDSTAKAASVAVSDDERLLALYNIDNGLTHSELMLPMAEATLKSLGLSFSDIGLLAASVGPGSFTGVRIGTALVKGIAFGRDIPCVSVSTLDALAENLSPLDGIIVAAMDARRAQVYTATYRRTDGITEKLTADRAISVAELTEQLRAYDGERIYVCGDGYDAVMRALDAAGIRVQPTPPLLINENAYSVAKVALRRYRSGDFTSDKEISPTYLRLPQAERERLERLKQSEADNN